MRVLRRWGVRSLVLPAAATLAGVAAPAAGRSPAPIAPGVTLAGIPVGGFGSEEARALVRAGLDAPLEFRLDGRSWTAQRARLGFYGAVDAAVAEALRAPASESVEIAVAIVPSALDAYVHALDRRLSRPARDARVLGLDKRLRPIVAREIVGRDLRRAASAKSIANVLRRADGAPARLVFTYTKPRETRRNLGPVIVIRRESKGLYVYERGRLLRRMTVATGQARYPTPLGTFTVAQLQRHPWWYPPDSDWARGLSPIPPGAGNPLGTRWMGLSVGGVGMHGTPDPASLGYSASHGCIRLSIPNAEWLFQRVRIGTPVVIVSA